MEHGIRFQKHLRMLYLAKENYLWITPRSTRMALSSQKFIVQFGFKNSAADTSLFIYNNRGVIIIFLVYVDDIVLTGNSMSFLNMFVSQLDKQLSLKDLGDLHHFLGVEVVTLASGLFLSQAKHISDLLVKHKLDGVKKIVTPMSSSTSLFFK